MIREPVTDGFAAKLVGESPCMQELCEHIAAVAAYDVNLLLQGESGTGKELVSRIVHEASERRGSPFIGINCAAIHESLLESELFGHEAGAFTGATCSTQGFLRAAEGGTILLDEIGDMSDSLQTKLLRALEERAVQPVGGTQPIPINIRVIAATHRDLAKAVAEGSFRQDLYYRLNVVSLFIPPLRDRVSDIPLVAERLLLRMGEMLRLPVKKLSSAALDVMMSYDWPGNVRQLGNVIQRAYVLGHGSTIQPADLPEELLGHTTSVPLDRMFPTLQETIHGQVMKALKISDGTRSEAAKMLGINRTSLWRMLRRYEMAH